VFCCAYAAAPTALPMPEMVLVMASILVPPLLALALGKLLSYSSQFVST
jgi:hypothetical protein